jgi:hypothetical protein
MIQASINMRPYSKSKAKGARGVAQVVEHLTSNCKALVLGGLLSDPSTTKKKKKEEED